MILGAKFGTKMYLTTEDALRPRELVMCKSQKVPDLNCIIKSGCDNLMLNNNARKKAVTV